MRFEKMELAAPRQNDPPAMREAIMTLKEQGYDVRRPNVHQLKVTPDLSYYPNNGKILVDGQSVRPERGLEALLRLLRDQGLDLNIGHFADV